MMLESRLNDLLDQHLELFTDRVERIVLAFSGGLDSCVLLHLLASRPRDCSLLIWHINHGLQDCADEMESFCASLAAEYGIEFRVSHLNLGDFTSNIESIARSARYAEFEANLGAQDILLTAHHADDQAETFLLNLMRSAGSAGLRGIAPIKPLADTRLVRPLLEIKRSELTCFANQQGLQWFDDPSNSSDRYNRNYLRNQVIPIIKNRWPGFVQSIASVCHIQAETQQLLDEIAAVDYQQCCISPGEEPTRLSQRQLMALSNARQKNLARFWLRENDCHSLPARKLQELIRQLHARTDAQPCIVATGYDIRIYAQQLFIVRHKGPFNLQQNYDMAHTQTLEIDSINLKISRADVLQSLAVDDCGQSISIQFRLDPQAGNPNAHRLKHLFQKYQVAPWLRVQTPQIFIDDELKAIWLDKSCQY